MEGIRIFSREELERMGQGEVIDAYLALKDRLLEQMAIDAEKDLLVKNLSERLNLGSAKQFGRSTERTSSLSGSSPDKMPPAAARETPQVQTDAPGKKGQPRRETGCADHVKEGIPVKDLHVTLTPEELEEVFGSYQWRELPEQTCDVLRYRKACLYIERKHIHVYTAGGKIVRAGKAEKMSPKSLASPEALAGILDAKFVMGIPISRFVQQAGREGGHLARQTLYGWVVRCCLEYFEAFVMRIAQLMLATGHIQADETPVTVNADGPDSRPLGQCYFWVFSTSELWPGERVVVFQYESSRGTRVLREFLEGYAGTLTCDAYSCYQTFEKEQEGSVTVTGCMTHLRRYFVDVLRAMKDFRDLTPEEKKEIPAYQAVEKLKKIFQAETPLQKLTAEERLRIRREKIQPLVEELFDWIHSFGDEDFEKGGLMQKALNYGKNQEVYLKRFLEDGYVPMHNSGSERSIIPLCIGRNNWRSIGSENGAAAAAYAYSIAETAKANHADPFYYYKFLLEQLPFLLREHGIEKDLSYLDCLMPWTERYRSYERQERERYRQEFLNLG